MNNQQNDDMDRQTLNVAFATQKGGSGKTAITVLVAGYLHYRLGCPLAVIDCDFPQYSIHDMRQRDMDASMNDDYYKVLAYEQFKRLKKKAYPIVCSKPEQAPEAARKLVKKGEALDFIFFDLPGTINNPGIVNTLAAMDYIFTPMSADKAVMRSSLKFASVINEHLITTGKTHIKGLYLLWNMVDGREKTDLYEIYEKICDEMALTVMKTSLPDSKRFRKETATERKAVFRSTLFPADKTLIRGSNLNKLVEEILTIIRK